MSLCILSRTATRHFRRPLLGARNFSFALSELDSHNVTNQHSPITKFTEDEEMTRDMARQWTDQELKPIVREMDNEAKLRPEILDSLFQCGFMGMVRSFLSFACLLNITMTNGLILISF